MNQPPSLDGVETAGEGNRLGNHNHMEYHMLIACDISQQHAIDK
jgi:hypothetical protein